jgi:hypothetical protein
MNLCSERDATRGYDVGTVLEWRVFYKGRRIYNSMAEPAQYQSTHCSDICNNNINQPRKEWFGMCSKKGKKQRATVGTMDEFIVKQAHGYSNWH